MSDTSTQNEPHRTQSNWAVSDDVDPIRIRDPVAEALCVLEPGDPFVITYEDVVKAAGHSCPTASGAFRMAQLGLEALYPDDLPVRSDVEVLLPGGPDDASDGVMGRLFSYITGAAEADGFGGLAGGYGGRVDLLTYEAFDAATAEPTVRFRRRETGETVEVTYHVQAVPDGGPAMANLQALVEGTATEQEREAFAEAWHGRVRAVLSDDDLFTVEPVSD